MQACQRHWTDGGTLRKVETGAGKRNSRRARGSGSVSTSEAGVSGHHKYARVSREVPQQNWSQEDFMQHRAQSGPVVPGGAPSYFDTSMPDHNSSDANMSFQEGSSFNPDKVCLSNSPSSAHRYMHKPMYTMMLNLVDEMRSCTIMSAAQSMGDANCVRQILACALLMNAPCSSIALKQACISDTYMCLCR
jgi:Dof domain, zinc finger